MSAIGLALLAALCWGIGSYVGGRATRRAAAPAVTAWGSVVAVTAMVPISIASGSPEEPLRALGWGVVAGCLGAIGAMSLYQGLATARAAVVAPLAGVLGASVPVVIGTLQGERPAALAWLGVALALPAIWLLSTQGRAFGPGARYGVMAGISFGLQFVVLSWTPEGSALWPIAASHAGAIVLMGAILRARDLGWRLPPSTRRPAVGAGALNVAAVSFFLLAARSGLVSLSSVIASLYPAPTVVLAVLLDGEEVRRHHVMGGALALTAIALITAAP